MSSCVVYLLKNKLNNKIYIGQTWQSLKDRFNNGKGYKHCPHLYNAINKYGKENFEYKILANCKTQEESNYLESFFINKYGSRNRNTGYNSKEGGSNGKMSEEIKKKMSASSKGRRPSKLCLENSLKARIGVKASDETRKKQSIAKLGKPSANIGSIMSKETKMKIGVANTGRKHSEQSRINMGNSQKGRKFSEETRRKISESNKGKAISEDTRKKLIESHLGHKHSKETIRKMVANKTGKFKLTKEKIMEIILDKKGCYVLARKYGVSKTTILNIRKNPKYINI